MEFSKEQTATMLEALETFGVDKQLDIAIEEMAELTKAIIKYRRCASKETYENLCEETADVAIMIEQIFLSTRCDNVAKYVVEKTNRLKRRVTTKKRYLYKVGADNGKAQNHNSY